MGAKDNRDSFQSADRENSFVGEGTLVHADFETLCETTRLSDREASMIATNITKHKVLDPKWKMGVGETFIYFFMKLKKSIEGQGIEDIKELYHVSSEEKAAEINKGAMFQ